MLLFPVVTSLVLSLPHPTDITKSILEMMEWVQGIQTKLLYS